MSSSDIGIYPDRTLEQVVDRLAYYDGLEEQGRLVALPAAPSIRPGYIKSALYIIVGSEIVVDYLHEAIIGEGVGGETDVVYCTHDGDSFVQSDVGKIVFPTREEAERELEKGK